MTQQRPTCSTSQTACVFTWTWPWGSVRRCSLWCGCCIRRRGLRTPSGWLGCPPPPRSLFPQCRPRTAADTTSHPGRACNPRYTWSESHLTYSCVSLFPSFLPENWDITLLNDLSLCLSLCLLLHLLNSFYCTPSGWENNEHAESKTRAFSG